MSRHTFLLYGCLLLASCGSPKSPVAPKVPSEDRKLAASKPELGPLLPAYELARVEPGTYGPVSVSLDGGTLTVWASPGQGERTWFARSLDRDGRASTASTVIGKTSLELGLVTLAPVSQGLRSLLVYSTQPTPQITKLHSILLDPTGAVKSPVTELATLNSSLLWTQIVDTTSGPMILYAASREDRAEVRAVGLTFEGKPRFVDHPILGGLRAWQAVAAPDGVALSVVRASGHSRGGIVSFLLLDATGAIARGPLDLHEQATAELDLDMTRVGKNYVLAWSDRQHIDTRIQLAAVDPSGSIVSKPKASLAAIGEQTLVRIVPPAKGGPAVLVWENPMLPFSRRMLSLAEVDELGQVGARVVHLACSSRSSTLPEIVSTEEGIRALTFDDLGGAAGNEPVDPLPTYVEFGPGLEPRAAVALTLESARRTATVPLLAWGLDCRHGCRATAALDDSPVTIASIPLLDAKDRPGAAERVKELVRVNSEIVPRLVRLDTVAELEPLADLAVTPQRDGFLMATLTYFDPTTPTKRLPKAGPDGRTDPLQARIDVFPMSADGDVALPQTISYRARSTPGLSIGAGKSDSDARAVAWSAMDQGQPQLFLTALSAEGKKRGQRMLTHEKGQLDELALVEGADGWLVSWVEERGDGMDLLAATTTKALDRRGAQRRLVNQAGEISALALVRTSDEGVVIYASTSRNEHRRGTTELYTQRLSLLDAQPLDGPSRILEVPGAVRFLQATNSGEGLVLGWLEIPAAEGFAERAGQLKVMGLDLKGKAISAPATLTEPDAVPASLAIDCSAGRCRGLVVADVGGRGELQGFTFDPKSFAVPRLTPLMRSFGTVEQNVAPVLLGEHVFLVDQIDAESAHVVHGRLKWE